MPFNPFWNFSREQCVQAISDIQERLANGAAMISGVGSGFVQHYNPDVDLQNLEHLSRRLAEIDGVPPPSRAQIKAFVITHRDYQ